MYMKITQHGTPPTANHRQACKWCGLTRKYAKIGKNNREKLGLMLKALYQSLGAISGNFE